MEWLSLAERELGCACVRSHEVREGETRAVVGCVSEEGGCLSLDDQVALVALDPRPDAVGG